MRLYLHLLKTYGLKGFISKKKIPHTQMEENKDTEMNQIEIKVDENMNVEEKQKKWDITFYKNWYIRHPINSVYFVFVGLLLLWPCIYSFVKAGIESDISYITSNVFTFLFFVLYILGLQYHQNNHFQKTIKRTKKYKKLMLSTFIIFPILTVILCSIMLILMALEINVNIYSELWGNADDIGKIFVGIIFFINYMYSYNIYFAIMVSFAIVFQIHAMEIRRYIDKLQQKLSTNTMDINSVIQEYTEIKSQHTTSVDILNNIFAAITVFGIIATYFLLINYDTKFVGVLNYVEVFCFILTELIYLFTINRIKTATSDIIGYINSPDYVVKYLHKVDTEQFATEFENNKKILKDISLRSYIKVNENSSDLNWIILSDSLGSSWEAFKILGFEVDDTTIMQKLVGIVLGLLMILHIGATFAI